MLTNPGSPVTKHPPVLFENIVHAAADAIVYADAEGFSKMKAPKEELAAAQAMEQQR